MPETSFEVKVVSRSEFYPTFTNWCISQDFPIVDELLLPQKCLVCSKDGVECYALWPYLTDGGVVWLAYPISDRNVSKEFKLGGLGFLFSFAEQYARELGYLMILTTSGTKSVIGQLLENGFNIMDEKVNQYIKHL
jgi:hypothetical protein